MSRSLFVYPIFFVFLSKQSVLFVEKYNNNSEFGIVFGFFSREKFSDKQLK